MSGKIPLICFLLAITIFIVDLQIPLGVAGGVPYIVVVLLTLWSNGPRWTIFFAGLCAALTLLGWYLSPSGGEVWKVAFNRGLALFAIGVTCLMTLKWREYSEQIVALRMELQNEKERIYKASIHSAQHIVNNMLNQLQFVELKLSQPERRDEELKLALHKITDEGGQLLSKLSSVEQIDEDAIRESVHLH